MTQECNIEKGRRKSFCSMLMDSNGFPKDSKGFPKDTNGFKLISTRFLMSLMNFNGFQ